MLDVDGVAVVLVDWDTEGDELADGVAVAERV